MIVLILVAILWVAVLVPGIISKLSERRSAGSIGRFHQRLDLLERTGPKLVKPAYRLTGTEAAASSSAPIVVPVAPPPVRPNLTLVPSPAEGASEMPEEIHDQTDVIDLDDVVVQLRPGQDYADKYAAEYHDDQAYDDEFVEETLLRELSGEDKRDRVALDRRRRARRRRRDTFGALCALAAVTGLLGLAHPLRGAWIASGIFVGLLVGFIGLAVYGQRIEAERQHLTKLERTRDAEPETESTIVKYLSSDELSQYHEALASYYESEDSRLVGGARAIG